MSRTLPQSHQALVAAMKRDTPGTDLPRYVAVLDALIAWSTARPGWLAFRDAETRADVVSFNRAKSKEAFWSVAVTRGTGPRLEIHLMAARPLSAQDRAKVMEIMNQHSREVLVEGERLRIGFGALKNAAALAAVLSVMEQLLATPKEEKKAKEPAKAKEKQEQEQESEKSTA
jgi:hypothetical protein